MHLRRSERLGRVAAVHPLRRLDVRFVLTLSFVAVLALFISGVAIYQVLPGYLVEQATKRLESAAQATGLALRDTFAAAGETQLLPEVRGARIYGPVAQQAANELDLGLVRLYENEQLMAEATSVHGDGLRAQGLQPDPSIGTRDVTDQLTRAVFPQLSVAVRIEVGSPYTSRVQTLERVGYALLIGGLVAFAAALVAGAWAASRLTRPLARLQSASVRIAEGNLGERVPPAEIAELDALGSQFNIMADQLAEMVRVISDDRDRLRAFIADVSHELRTPIAALRTFTDLQRDGGVDEETRREFLDRSSEQISRLEWMSNNLLDLSRIDAGIFPLDVRDDDLRDPLRSVVEAHAEVAEERGVGLTVEVPSSPVVLAIDRQRIVQLVTNLVGNALKFTSPGGSVVVRLDDRGPEAVIEVRDTGPGVPPAELPHIFNRFYRGTNTGEARASGSGLGLAIARSIAQMHDGEIQVESVVGGGSVFRVRLPRPAANAMTSSARQPRAGDVPRDDGAGMHGEDQ